MPNKQHSPNYTKRAAHQQRKGGEGRLSGQVKVNGYISCVHK